MTQRYNMVWQVAYIHEREKKEFSTIVELYQRMAPK